jgi:hypothetical protein
LKDKGQRKHVRKLVHKPVRYTDRAGLSSGVIRDISLGGGVYLEPEGSYRPKESIGLFFPFHFRENRLDNR